MKQNYLIWIGWIAVTLLALYLRLPGLGEPPMHFDEATGARLLARQLEGDNPTFDPTHFHGPWLRESSTPIAGLRNETNWQSLSVETLRLHSVLAGMLLCFTPLLWRTQIGMPGALAAAALLASSPLLVYYNRMYIHESWLALFGMVACAALFKFIQKPSYRIGLLAGISIGLMFATKETFAISILSWGFAALALLWSAGKTKTAPSPRAFLKPCLLLGLVATMTSAYFYSDGFSHPTGFIDACRTYFVYETTGGHEKGFLEYAHNLIWPKHRLGLWWTEVLLAALALAALVPLVRGQRAAVASRFVAISFLAHFLIYSLIAYKTPWLMLLPWAHLCLLGGMAFVNWQRSPQALRWTLALMLIWTLAWQSRQSLAATGRFANDARNPYAYVPTSGDLVRLSKWLNTLNATNPLSPAAVVGSGYWPLPWYLRELEDVGYWQEVLPEFRDYPILFVMPDQVSAADALLVDSHERLPRGLRDNVALIVYLRKDIWKEWNNAGEDE